MRLTTTVPVTIHLPSGEQERKIYVESNDVCIHLKDKMVLFYVDKGYVEDFEDPILKSTIQRDYRLTRTPLKIDLMNVLTGDLIEVVDAELKVIIEAKIANNEAFLSGMTTYTFE